MIALARRQKLTRLQLSNIAIPPGADASISEAVGLISDAADIRRTVNGEAIQIARDAFRKYRVGITCSDMHSAGLHSVSPGDYVECIPTEPFSVSLPVAATSVTLPRAGIEAVGVKSNGEKVAPIAQLPAQALQNVRSSGRISALRARPVVTFSEPVALVRFRPILACVVVEWSSDAAEKDATASWSLTLEEI